MATSTCRKVCKLFGQKHSTILHALCYLSPEQTKSLLKHADLKLIKCICECALNILNGNITLNKHQKGTLSKHRLLLRKLAENRGTWKKKKNLVIQRGGGFLPLLLAPLLGSILSNIFASATE